MDVWGLDARSCYGLVYGSVLQVIFRVLRPAIFALQGLNPVANPSKLQKTLRATKAPIKPTKARECLLLFIEAPTPHPGEQSSTEGVEIGLLSPKPLSPQTPKP